jgi:hypothetical protein
MPKATVKMQQTQPLVRQGAGSAIQGPALQTAPAMGSGGGGSGSDGLMNILAIAAFVVSIGAAVLAYLAYTASQLT